MERNYDFLINKITENLKNKLRKYERSLKKINLNYWKIEFNSTCLNKITMI